ncbi:MAG: ABC transporter permease [Pseudomonadota bacterium]
MISKQSTRALVSSEEPFIRIRSGRQGLRKLVLREFWNYRDLFLFLVWRDILVWYKQTALGAAWAILQPLMAMVIFAVVFGRLAKLPSDGLPYPVFAYSALLLWTYFSQSLTQAAGSLINNEKLVTKIYFPRLMMPLASVVACLLNLGISSCMLFFLVPFYGVDLSRHAWALPLPIALTVITATGTGFWLAALNVKYRDIRYVVPFLVQIWMFASPVVYPVSIVPENWRLLYGLNPMAGAIEGFRWALLGTSDNFWSLFAVSTLVGLGVLVSGVVYFQNAEDHFADLI